jgi:Bifunctional DNA primase/polymerase, N-terminal
MSKDALQIALGVLARGWNPVKLDRKTKKPVGLAWQKRRITRETAPQIFNGHDCNVGVQLGGHSDGLTDVDLDCREAVAVGAMMLPKSNNIFGRASKRRSHWLYRSTLAEHVDKACLQFRDPAGGAMMLELKIGGAGKGSQSVFPGSVHADSGEVIEWDQDGALVEVDADKLYRSVHRLAVAVLLARHWPAKGSRHDAALTLGGVLARAGFDADEAAEMLEVIGEAAGDAELDDRVQAARDAVAQFANGGETRGMPSLAETFDEKVAQKVGRWLNYEFTQQEAKPSVGKGAKPSVGKRKGSHIKVVGGQLPRVVDQAEAALLASGHELYQRGLLVRPAIVPLKASDVRDTKGWRLIPLTEPYLVDIMTRVARFVRFDKRSGDWVPINAPLQVAKTYLARAGEWKLPVLSGVVNTPFLRADGSLCQKPGYDAATGLLFKPDGQSFPKIPERPSKADALAALAKLREPIAQFPFVTKADEAVALSGMLTGLDRCALPNSPPLHGYDAPVAGSGKSKLVDITSVMMSGYEAPAIGQGRNEEELEKRLDASLLAGDPIINIDNCSQPLKSTKLNLMLTQVRVRVRILGKSKQPEVPPNIFVCCTGNGLVLVGDLTRRTLRCRLDPKVERPELREFEFDPVVMVRERRGELVVAALTILRAWLLSGERMKLPPLGSFETWSRRVREALVWLGCADPCDTVESVRADDPQRSDLGAILAQWEQHLGLFSRHSAADVIKCATTTHVRREDGTLERVARADFKHALLSVAGSGGERINHQKLGIWLASNEKKIVDGMWLCPKSKRDGSKTWSLRPSRKGGG